LAYLCQKSIRFINFKIIVIQKMKKYKMRSFRISEELDKKLTDFSRKNLLSRSKIIKKSIRKLLEGKE